MRVGLCQIASEAGVDKPAVSRILNGKAEAARISPQRAEHVRRVAHRLGYRPNLAARTLSTGRFFNVLMVHGTRPATSGLSWDVLTAAYDGLAAAGYHLSYARVPDKQLTDPEYVPEFLRHWMCDGLLINYIAAVPDRMVELIRAHGLPSIWINVKAESDCVHPDDFAAGAMIARRLLELGHRRIAYADFWFHSSAAAGHQHYSKPDRLDGCRQALAQAGLEIDLWCDRDWAPGLQVSFMRERLARADRPTAVIGYGETEIRACQLAAAEVGLAVPGDLSLADFGISFGAPRDELHLSTALQPDVRVGAEAVRLLLAKMKQPAESQPTVTVPFVWEEGWTVAPPK